MFVMTCRILTRLVVLDDFSRISTRLDVPGDFSEFVTHHDALGILVFFFLLITMF